MEANTDHNTENSEYEHVKTLAGICAESDGTAVQAALCDSFGMKPGDGNQVRLTLEDGEVSLLYLSVDMGEQAEETIGRQAVAVINHFAVPMPDARANDIALNVIHQLQAPGSFLSMTVAYDGDDDSIEKRFTQSFIRCIEALRGLTVDTAGDALYGADGRMVLNITGASEVDSFYPTKVVSPAALYPNADIEAIDRRNRSLQLCRDKGIFVIGGIPLLETAKEVQPRNAGDIAKRMICCLAVSMYAYTYNRTKGDVKESRKWANDILNAYGAKEALSDGERSILQAREPDQSGMERLIWRFECVYAFERILGLNTDDSLDFPEGPCDIGVTVSLLRNQYISMDNIVDAAKLADVPQILDQADLLACLDWVSRDALTKNHPAPSCVYPISAMERAAAYAWVIEQDGWDEYMRGL